MESNSHPRIFIVEDNLIYQQLIAKELDSLSGEFHFYTNGEDCIHDLQKRPSIVVLDFDLDGGLNGLETMLQIREFDASIYVILFSSQKNLNSCENMVQYGSFDFLEKREHSFQLLKQMITATHFNFKK